jgi:hypothetical protein
MHVIKATSADHAFVQGLDYLLENGVKRNSRNGPVLVAPEPVTTQYVYPDRRVLFNPVRDANPFFHIFEAIWMLAGRNDLAFCRFLVNRMADFSDDGLTFHGAYGYRWRHHFHTDQLEGIISRLRHDPNDRRCVLQMWDANIDFNRFGKDFPCNLVVMFGISHEGKLDMTVTCRSNDFVLGALGANVVHFSILQEYMANKIGVPLGQYWQVSNNYHLYLNEHEKLLAGVPMQYQARYAQGSVYSYSLGAADPAWDFDLIRFFTAWDGGEAEPPRSVFFGEVIIPLFKAFTAYKSKKYDEALDHVGRCRASDWKMACKEWLLRRKVRHERAKDDGVSYGK